MDCLMHTQSQTSYCSDPGSVPVDWGWRGWVLVCSPFSLDFCFQPVELTYPIPENLGIRALLCRRVNSTAAACPPSLLTGLGAKSENCFVAQLHRDCCCRGDSQTAQSPLLLSGVPQHEKWVGHVTHWSLGGLSALWHLAWRIVGLFGGVGGGEKRGGGYSALGTGWGKYVSLLSFHSFNWTEQQWPHCRLTPICSLLGLKGLPSLNQDQLQSYPGPKVALFHQ